MTEYLKPHAFFTIDVSYENLHHHPFVRKKVIPALQKTHAKEIEALRLKYKKRFSSANLYVEELADKAWGLILYDLIKHYIKLESDDRSLSFGLMAGGASEFIIWDNFNKNMYPSNGFSFDVIMSKQHQTSISGMDGEVAFRGKLSTTVKNGKKLLALKIYFYVEDTSEDRDVGAKTVSQNVGMICEVPYFFLGSDRYETLQDTNTTNTLLEMFDLRIDDEDYSPPDYIPTDELGESYRNSGKTVIGNDYVTVWID